ncbi:MAG: hypothetical protein AAF840_07450 [Bacteroidota bacterium]
MEEKRDPFDGEYIGSIFSRKVIIYGGFFLLFFLGLAAYRYWSMGLPFGSGMVDTTIPTEEVIDSTQTNE